MDIKNMPIVLFIGAIGLVAFFLTSRKSYAMSNDATDIQLSKDFKLSEFLRSEALPEIANYRPTTQEVKNLKFLVDNIIQPLRDKFGPIFISGGARPMSVKNSKGQTIYDLLKDEGKKPSKTSDHEIFAGADLEFNSPEKFALAYKYVQTLPKLKQAILYTYTDNTGKVIPRHLHVGVKLPDGESVPSNDVAFIMLNRNRVPSMVV